MNKNKIDLVENYLPVLFNWRHLKARFFPWRISDIVFPRVKRIIKLLSEKKRKNAPI